jgi:predicted GTPase
MPEKKVLIVGSGGREFHNFNVVYRDDPAIEVVAFVASEQSAVVNGRYPASLAGPNYPDGIPIALDSEFESLCRAHRIGTVVFARSDVKHQQVMHFASRALAEGADFVVLGPERTMVEADAPVVAVSGSRTGVGKSQVSRWVAQRLLSRGLRVAVVRYPVQNGARALTRIQRFASLAELDEAECTVEEREEYEPHVAAGNVVYAGVDYQEVVAQAALEADVIVWDGGNSDYPLVRPDLHIGVTDALRLDHATQFHPGEAVLRMADVILVNKVDAAATADVQRAVEEARQLNPEAVILRAASPVHLEHPGLVQGKQVLVIEDGPTVTHGDMPYGAGYVAAVSGGAASVVDPRPFAAPGIAEVFEQYPQIGDVLPAIGYDRQQLEALQKTIAAAPVDTVVIGTPIDLASLIVIPQQTTHARYGFAEVGNGRLGTIIDAFIAERIDTPSVAVPTS